MELVLADPILESIIQVLLLEWLQLTLIILMKQLCVEHTSFSIGNIPESCSVLWNNLTTINNTFNNVFGGIGITPFVYYDQNAKANGN